MVRFTRTHRAPSCPAPSLRSPLVETASLPGVPRLASKQTGGHSARTACSHPLRHLYASLVSPQGGVRLPKLRRPSDPPPLPNGRRQWRKTLIHESAAMFFQRLRDAARDHLAGLDVGDRLVLLLEDLRHAFQDLVSFLTRNDHDAVAVPLGTVRAEPVNSSPGRRASRLDPCDRTRPALKSSRQFERSVPPSENINRQDAKPRGGHLEKTVEILNPAETQLRIRDRMMRTVDPW